MSDNSQTKRERGSYLASPGFFFLLVMLLSFPFYVLGTTGNRFPIATFLPLSALMTFLPMIAALILVYRQGGVGGAKEFLVRAFDYRRIKGVAWVLAALLLMPIIALLEYGVLRVGGRALPDAQFFAVAEIVAFFLMFFIGAVGEELGWQGYAYARLNHGRSALNAALIIGAIWALWHVIPYAQMGRSAEWILWQCLGTIALRVIIVWLFVNTGQSVVVSVLFHTMINMPWGLIQNYGLFYDPFVMFVILALVACVAAVYLARNKQSQHPTFGRRRES